MNFKRILKNAESISRGVKAGKDPLGDTIYKIHMHLLDEDLQVIVEDVKDSLQKKLTTEMRYTDSVEAVQCCVDVAEFSINILNTNIPNELKIALFGQSNIFGYMIDRNKQSYVACREPLGEFLDSIEQYIEGLPSAELKIWNNSTRASSKNVAFARGYLRGITAKF